MFQMVLLPKPSPPISAASTNSKPKWPSRAERFFGSGWVWLVLDGGKKLTVLTLPNQDSPLTEGHYPLFGIDVWEHAYYLKYHNVRADYITAIWNVVNWDFITSRYHKPR